MKIITHKMIEDLNLDPNLWYEWVDTVLKNKDKFIMPAKTSIHMENGTYFNTMPSIIPMADVMGVKVVNRFLGRTPSLESQLLLYDYKTGTLKAIMDANMITAMRTGAAAAHAIELYAVKDFKEIGIMGFGNIGVATLEVTLAHFKDRPMHIKLLKYKDHAEKMVERFKRYTNVEFEIVDTTEEIIKGSDVVISSITYTEDFIGELDWFKKGCLVLPVHLRGFQNCDRDFDKVYGDDTAQVSGFKYFNEFKSFAETSEVLRGEKPGRENDDERILAYYVGMSLHDIYAAAMLYNEFSDVEDEKLTMGPTERYWL
ncbi:MAG: ornithine cyclodeaminase [Eubacterium sp.]|nr:ornithine cyclodeaminase [Eubacterium sp.]MDE6413512.1 ornithine cyclodeaminase [Eubacterium sp.]